MLTVAGTDKNDRDTYLCIRGMTIDKELADDHVCNTRGAVKAAPVLQKTPEDWDENDEIKNANKIFGDEEVKTEEGMKFAGATTYTKRHDARRANTQNVLCNSWTNCRAGI